jgi:uncharacterized membrane protein YbjE (DUF340 family)
MVSAGVVVSVIVGVFVGMFLVPPSISRYSGVVIDIGLCFLLFWVGVDIGKNRKNITGLSEYGWRIALIPLGIVVGSIAATMTVGLLMGYPAGEAGAVGAGLGWYSLSGVMISELHSIELGAVAFLTNVFRELMALMMTPLIAKRLGPLEAIAPAGATAMDTTLPVISRSTGPETAIKAFLVGAVLTAVVPVLVPLVLKIPF